MKDIQPEIEQHNEPQGITGIEAENKNAPIESFGYSLSGNTVYLESYIGHDKVLEINTSYAIDGVNYWTDISNFMIGIGNSSVKTVIFDEGFTELYGPVFNSTDVENVFFPRSMTRIYDNTISYLHPHDQAYVKIYYAGTQEEWKNIFTQYQRTRVEDAEFGEELGTAIADKVNEMIGSGYDSSEYEYFFSASPDDLR